MRKRLIPLAVLGCLAFAPGAAEAATLTEYQVVIEGSGDWQRHDAVGGGSGSYERQAKFSWKSTLPGVLFYGKELRQSAPQKISTAVAEARDDMVLPTPTGTFAGFCTGGPAVARAGELGRALVPTAGGKEALDVRVLGALEVEVRECGGDPVVSPTTLVLDAGTRALGDGPFDARVEMPHEAIGMGKIIELLAGSVSGQRCPRWTNASVSCTLRWKATVTFTRTRQQDVGAPPPAPEPDVVTGPDIEPLPLVPEGTPPFADDDLLLPLTGKLRASSATVTIACPAGCAGTAAALPLRAAKPLALRRFAAPAGRPERVTLRFGTRARRAIRRSGAVRVVVRAGGERAQLTLRRR